MFSIVILGLIDSYQLFNLMVKKYTKGDIKVVWKPDLCIHSAKCVGSLPEVFKPSESPWIQLEHGEADRIVKTVLNCPSGALSIQDESNAQKESPAVSVSFIENGPIIIEGEVRMAYKGESLVHERKRISLCRCGASSNKPYCDGTHRKTDFAD